MGKMGLAVSLAKKTANFVKNCDKRSILETKVQNLKSIHGIKYNKLKTDTVHFTSDSRWVGNPEEFIPKAFEGSFISLHHQMHSFNSSFAVRDVLADIKQGIFKEKDITLMRKILKTDKEFAKLPPLEKNCIFFRGRTKHPFCQDWNKDFEIINKAKIGDTIVPDTAYSYGAFKRKIAKLWAKPSKEYKTMMYEIRLPKGAKVSRNLEHEGEVVMPRSAEYKLISKKEDSDGCINTVLEYILPGKEMDYEIKKIEKFLEQFPVNLESVVKKEDIVVSKSFFTHFLNIFKRK